MRNYKRVPSNISSHRSDSELDSLNISTSKQTQTLEEQFNLWINTLNANLSKRLYKNVFQDISSNLKKYYSLSIHSKAIVLKIRTILKIIEMKGLLAKCTDDKKILVNPRIIKYKRDVVEYIILHQFAHLKYKNHTKSFYNFMEKYLPEYKKYENLVNMKY